MEDSQITTKSDQYDCARAHKTVGNQFTQSFQILTTAASFFSTQIATSYLTCYETWFAYFSVSIQISYTFACTAYTKQNLDHLASQPGAAMLLKLGYNQKKAHTVVFGSGEFEETGLRHLFIEQGIGKTLILIWHIHAKNKIGKLIIITISWLQLNAGVSYSLLKHPYDLLPYLE